MTNTKLNIHNRELTNNTDTYIEIQNNHPIIMIQLQT